MKKLITLILILCSVNLLASETPQLTSLWGSIPTAIAKPGDTLHFLSIPTGGSDLEFRFYSSTDGQPNVVLKDWSRDNFLNTTLPITFSSVIYFGEVRGVGQPNSIYASQTYGFIKEIELSATSLFPNDSLTVFHPTFSVGNDYHVRFSNPAGFMVTVNTVANINGQISVLVPAYNNPQTGENETGRVTVVVDGMRVRARPMLTIRQTGQIPVADFSITLENGGAVPFQASFDASLSYLPGHENEPDRGIASCSWQVLGGGTGDKNKKLVPGCQLSQLISTIGAYTVTLNISFVNGDTRTISKQFQAIADINRCSGQPGQLQGNVFVANTAALNTTGVLSGKIDICDSATVTGNVSIENFTTTAVKISGNAQVSESASIRTASGAEVVINGNSIVKGTVKLFSRYILNITDSTIIEDGAIVTVGQVGGTGSAGEISIKGDSNILGDGLLETVAFNGHKATIIIEDAIINTGLSAHALNADASISVKGILEGPITLCANSGQIVTDSNVVINSTPEFCQSNVNIPPIINFGFSQINPEPPYNFNFDASASSDPDGEIVTYVWHFSDQQTATGKIVNHTFQTPGNHSASLTITDNEGQQASLSKQFFIEDNSPLYKITVTPFGGIPPYTYAWMNGSTTNSAVVHEGSWAVSVHDSSGEIRSKFFEVGPSKCILAIDSGWVDHVTIDFTFTCENVVKK